ncbi:MAG: hypothetical protein KGL53_06635, partial [Elusimicrobia bacterium]|nr:hypothetical protein [Elusimicrobiota bacterium]
GMPTDQTKQDAVKTDLKAAKKDGYDVAVGGDGSTVANPGDGSDLKKAKALGAPTVASEGAAKSDLDQAKTAAANAIAGVTDAKAALTRVDTDMRALATANDAGASVVKSLHDEINGKVSDLSTDLTRIGGADGSGGYVQKANDVYTQVTGLRQSVFGDASGSCQGGACKAVSDATQKAEDVLQTTAGKSLAGSTPATTPLTQADWTALGTALGAYHGPFTTATNSVTGGSGNSGPLDAQVRTVEQKVNACARDFGCQ